MEEQGQIPECERAEAAAAKAKQDREAAVEREQVEQVFGLTGGELSDGPWAHATPVKYPSEPGDCYTFGHAYWYEGVPEYAGEDFRDHYSETYRTALTFGGGFMDGPAENIYDGSGAWELVKTFTSSGEAPCPMRQTDSPHDRPLVDSQWGDGGCPLCEAGVGEEHGYIYIGEGYEAVYKLIEIPVWEVYVGNVGNVFTGTDGKAARKQYEDYVQISGEGHGRAGGESVQLVKDDEVVEEHVGTNDDSNDDSDE